MLPDRAEIERLVRRALADVRAQKPATSTADASGRMLVVIDGVSAALRDAVASVQELAQGGRSPLVIVGSPAAERERAAFEALRSSGGIIFGPPAQLAMLVAQAQSVGFPAVTRDEVAQSAALLPGSLGGQALYLALVAGKKPVVASDGATAEAEARFLGLPSPPAELCKAAEANLERLRELGAVVVPLSQWAQAMGSVSPGLGRYPPIVTISDLEEMTASGQPITIPRDARLTDAAQEWAERRGITIQRI